MGAIGILLRTGMNKAIDSTSTSVRRRCVVNRLLSICSTDVHVIRERAHIYWAVGALSLLLVNPILAVPTYRVLPLGLLGPENIRSDGFGYSEIWQINAKGQIVGESGQYVSGRTPVGKSLWIFDGTRTINIGLSGSDYTGSDGYSYSDFGGRFALGPTRFFNDAGEVIGTTYRYGNSGGGTGAWIYDGHSTIEIGLVGPGYTGSNGLRSNVPLWLNGGGQVVGISNRYRGLSSLGQSVWLSNGTSTFEIGLTTSDYTRADGYRSSSADRISEAGQVRGASARFNGGTAALGVNTWIYDGTNTVVVGLTGAEHTSSSGYQYSRFAPINYGYYQDFKREAAGTSQRYNGGSTYLGLSAWYFDGTTTIDVGLNGNEHTRSDGYKDSEIVLTNEAGQVLGKSYRYNGGNE